MAARKSASERDKILELTRDAVLSAESEYAAGGTIMGQLGCCRRTAVRWIAAFRSELAAVRSSAVQALCDEYVIRLRRAMARAEAAGDRQREERLLDQVGRLVELERGRLINVTDGESLAKVSFVMVAPDGTETDLDLGASPAYTPPDR